MRAGRCGAPVFIDHGARIIAPGHQRVAIAIRAALR